MNSRTLGAATGLVVSAGCIWFLLSRVYEAGQPAPTRVQLHNASGAALAVDGIDLGDGPVLRGPFALAASAPPVASGERPMAPGRPVTVSLRSAGTTAACTLEPRPQGVCVVEAVFKGGAQLQCDYDCKPQAPVP